MNNTKWAVGAVLQGQPMSSMTKRVFTTRKAADSYVEELNISKAYSVVVVQQDRYFQHPAG